MPGWGWELMIAIGVIVLICLWVTRPERGYRVRKKRRGDP